VKKFKLSGFATNGELARAAANAWLDELAANHAGPAHCVALSGGRIAKTLFASVVESANHQSGALENVHFFWADERCVATDNEESNFGVARELLFAPLSIPNEHLHRIRGEESTDFAVDEAEAEICRIAPLAADGQPVLDLIFLGMGEDGHVASLFPGEAESAMTGRAVYRAVSAAKPPPHRITMGYAAIAAARQVWVLVSGPGKEAALRDSLSPSGQTPLARVIKSRPQTRIYTDIPSL
jgi:6-phosphogluconolactonase